jgi:hypothetical protein
MRLFAFYEVRISAPVGDLYLGRIVSRDLARDLRVHSLRPLQQASGEPWSTMRGKLSGVCSNYFRITGFPISRVITYSYLKAQHFV